MIEEYTLKYFHDFIDFLSLTISKSMQVTKHWKGFVPRVSNGYEFTHGASKMGTTGTGMVLNFGIP